MIHPLSDATVQRLAAAYPLEEARALARHILETRFGITRLDLLSGRVRPLSSEERRELENIVDRLLQKEPVQYILEQAEFCGRAFCVTPGVLVPRPETEELVRWITDDYSHTAAPPSHLLDIGTGSGCIAITLALAWPGATVTATDISPTALSVARENALRLQADVAFRQEDILTAAAIAQSPKWDLIVSNPPYVCDSERKDMDNNVLCHEPHVALFVPDERPLLFYESIGRYAVRTLHSGGSLYVEINRNYGADAVSLFRSVGFREVSLRQDLYGNDRMIKCRL